MAKNENENQTTTAKELRAFASQRGLDVGQCFDNFMRWIIWAHTLPEYGAPLKDWPYEPADGKVMYDIYRVLIQEQQQRLQKSEWCDIFGEIYEELIASKSRRSDNGQFFTPKSLCDLMTDISSHEEEKIVGQRISDPTCGSGRNLLAFHAKHPGNYHVAEDLDKTCVLMTVCNFILHGVNGEVIWHNALIPDDFKGGWRVNEHLNNRFSKYHGIPHLRPMTQEEYMSRFDKEA